MQAPTYRSLLVDAVVLLRKLGDHPSTPQEDRAMVERWITLATRLLYPPQGKPE